MDAPSFGLVPQEILATKSGFELLTGMIEGLYPGPPAAQATGIRLTEVEKGRVVFEGWPNADFLNPLGTIHGGWSATILDSAMACAVHSTLEAGRAYTTLEFKLHCVRPVLPDSGPLRCEGKVVHVGATIATSEGKLIDGRGKLLAHGTETCLIFPANGRNGS